MVWLESLLPLTPGHRRDFYDLLARFVRDGIPLYEGLLALDEQYQRVKAPMRRLTAQALRRLRGEQAGCVNLADALQGLVPETECLAIASGEDAGQIAEGLISAGRISGHAASIRQAIRAELAYPIFLLVLLLGLLLGIAHLFIPVLEAVLPRAQWPADAHRLAQMTSLATWGVPLLVALILGVACAFYGSRDRWSSAARDWLDNAVVPWSMHRRIAGALMLSYMAALVATGVPLSSALERLYREGGQWQRDHIGRMRTRLRLGQREGAALATPLFDVQIRWQIELYARLSDFSVGLQSLADQTIDATRQRIVRTCLVVRYVLMFTIAALIAWIYLIFVSITMAARSLA